MGKRLYVLVAFASIITLGIAANGADNIPDEPRAILDKAEQIELLSLDPVPSIEKLKDGFHGWKVLGKTAVKDAEVRKKLVAAFKKGVADNDGMAAFCFNPRHGIRAIHDGKTVDFVICFECFQVQSYVGDKNRVLNHRFARGCF